MNDTHKYQSISDLLNGSEYGFVILHQESALGTDFRDKEKESDEGMIRLKHHAGEAKSQLRDLLGMPSIESAGWRIGVPTWASGGGYALWTRKEDFVSSFIIRDNPEDPVFVSVGRAAVEDFNADHRDPELDPWESNWMGYGVW